MTKFRRLRRILPSTVGIYFQGLTGWKGSAQHFLLGIFFCEGKKRKLSFLNFREMSRRAPDLHNAQTDDVNTLLLKNKVALT